MYQEFPSSSPFSGFKINDQQPLWEAEAGPRSLCPSCRRSVKYFCYRCVRLMESLESDIIPTVALPIDMKILKHEQELDSKSTAIHAKLLAPSQISIHQFHRTDVSSYSTLSSDLVDEISANPAAYVILFPDESAVELKDLPEDEFKAIKNVIVIDGTWSQAAAINRTDPYCRVRRIKISPGWKTVFWRYQDLGEHCLSTIEAIYYFMREYHQVKAGRDNVVLYDGRFDNLLYFFSFFYHLIQKSYINSPDRKYTSRHRSDYIKRE